MGDSSLNLKERPGTISPKATKELRQPEYHLKPSLYTTHPSYGHNVNDTLGNLISKASQKGYVRATKDLKLISREWRTMRKEVWEWQMRQGGEEDLGTKMRKNE